MTTDPTPTPEEAQLLRRRRRVARMGWRPDSPDPRDLLLAAPSAKAALLPAVFDSLPATLPGVWDQGEIGSCTAHAILALAAAAQGRLGLRQEMLSRLFLYYAERVIEGTVAQDAGAEIRDGMRALASVGAPPETLWPYDVAKFAARPPASAFKAALLHQSLAYARTTRDLTSLKTAIFRHGPVAFGFTVSQSFEGDIVAKTGLMPLPERGEEIVGGHAVAAVGWNDSILAPGWTAPGAYLVRNSWGRNWGIQSKATPLLAGHFWFPYSLMADRGTTSDFWVLDQIEGTRAVIVAR